MIGLKRANKLYFLEKYPELNLKFAADDTLQRNKYRVSVDKGTIYSNMCRNLIFGQEKPKSIQKNTQGR